MDKLVRVLGNFGIVVSNPNRSSVFFYPCFQRSVCLSIVHEVAINVADLVNNSSALLFGRNVFKVLMTLFLTFGSNVWFQFFKKVFKVL